MNFNKVILAGYLTRDPEIRYTPAGMAIANASIALNRTWKTDTGESKEEVTFVEMTAFSKAAEAWGQYLRKGSPLLVEGRLRLETWNDKQTGKPRQKLSVVVETFQFLPDGQKGERAERQPAKPSEQKAPEPATGGHGEDANDDVPF